MPNGEPAWLPAEEAIDANQELVSQTGEPHQLRDGERLEGALARPRNLFAYEHEEDIVVLAVSLIAAISKGHAFLQGNKRTGWVCGLTFLAMNSYEWVGEDTEEWGEFVEALEVGTMTEEQLVSVMRPYVIPF